MVGIVVGGGVVVVCHDDCGSIGMIDVVVVVVGGL